MAYDASALPDVSGLTVGILGGTGDQGRGLAYRFARAGQQVLIGSRSAERAAEAAAEIAALPGCRPASTSTGGDNDEVARRSRRGHRRGAVGRARGHRRRPAPSRWPARSSSTASTRSASTSRARTRCRSPRAAPPSRPRRCCPTPGSAPRSTTSARRCWPTRRSTGSTSTCWCSARTAELVDIVGALAARIPGMRGIYAGRLRNAHQVEALTANLIAINSATRRTPASGSPTSDRRRWERVAPGWSDCRWPIARPAGWTPPAEIVKERDLGRKLPPEGPESSKISAGDGWWSWRVSAGGRWGG